MYILTVYYVDAAGFEGAGYVWGSTLLRCVRGAVREMRKQGIRKALHVRISESTDTVRQNGVNMRGIGA